MGLSALEQQALRRFRDEVRQAFGERVLDTRLFGSRARGEGRDDSDLDVLVVIAGLSRDERGRVLDIGADISMDMGLVMSPLVRDGTWLTSESPLAHEIATEGVPL
jgi:uncharacterized protein